MAPTHQRSSRDQVRQRHIIRPNAVPLYHCSRPNGTPLEMDDDTGPATRGRVPLQTALEGKSDAEHPGIPCLLDGECKAARRVDDVVLEG